MKIGIIGYVPPPNIGHPQAFLDNINSFKHEHELLLYSDHDWPNITHKVPSPEVIKKSSPQNLWAVPALAFLHGLRLAIIAKFDYVLILEPDVRVGCDGWDKIITDEAFKDGEFAAAGTIICYNPFNGGRENADKFVQFITKHNIGENNWRKPITVRVPRVATYGSKGMKDHSGCAAFPNGALAVYHVETLKKVFGKNDIVTLAANSHAWDLEIGKGLWTIFGDKVFDNIRNLSSIYSSYGDVITTEHERISMLESGQVVGIHQVKSNWTKVK
jgi:hypothetical protein